MRTTCSQSRALCGRPASPWERSHRPQKSWKHLRSRWWLRAPPGGAGKEWEGLVPSIFILCSKVCAGSGTGTLGAFSRFCMLLLKASCCISFCLSLPTCKMGPIPPTSLTSPSSSTQLGQVRWPALCTTGVRGPSLDASLPPVVLSPPPTRRCLMGLSLSVLCSLVPSSCSAMPRAARLRVPKQRLKQGGSQGGEPSRGVSPTARSPGAVGVFGGRSQAGACVRWLYGDRSPGLGPRTGTRFLDKQGGLLRGRASSARAGGSRPQR